MRKASLKDIFRTVWKEKKRFVSIMMITFLGVTMMTGIEAGCRDLQISADQFYDSQKLFDISIMSTLGLTEEDVLEIQNMEGIEYAEGTFTEIVHTKNGDVNRTAEIKIYKENGLNTPYVLEGRLPTSAKEIAVSENYLKETKKSIGDSLVIEEIMDSESEEDTTEGIEKENSEITSDKTDSDKIEGETADNTEKEAEDEDEISLDMDSEVELEEEETPNFPNTEYVIVGTLIDVMDINNAEGTASFRATPNADYTFFVTPEAVDSEVYTAVYASLEGTQDLLCYSQEYETKIEELTYRIETEIMEQRELARHQQLTGEAYEKITEKEEEMYSTFADIEQEFADAWQEIEDGRKELLDGKQELVEKEQEAKEEIADARKELEDAHEQLDEAWAKLTDAERQLNTGEAQLEEGKAELRIKEEEALKQLEEGELLLKDKVAQNETSAKQLDENLMQTKEMFGTLWSFPVDVSMGTETVNVSLEQAWKDYVEATGEVILPVISKQIDKGDNVTQEDMQSLIQKAMNKALGKNQGNNEYAYVTGILTNVIQKLMEIIQLQMGEEASTPDPDMAENLMSLAVGIATCDATETVLDGAMTKFQEQKEYALKQLEEGKAKLEQAELELQDGRAQLSEGRAEVLENYQKWEDGMKELEESEQEALLEIADAWDEIAEGEIELLDGEKELEEHEVEYYDKRKEAEEKIADAKQEVADIDMTKWYVQDRTSLSGYVNVDSDTSCIESLSTVFTIVFFVVAILISLTTVTRMVEEERGLIGTYKALGFTDGEIRRKYMVYAFGASVLGAILGDVGGFVILPEILFVFFRVMYVLPVYVLKFEVFKGTLAAMLFIIGIAGAAFVACHSELKHMPAHLMRPKAPKEGSRVFLEYIKPLWKRMSFLNKVTARNLFRYKKRMIMTVFGIMGCTALLLFGLAIKDSVDALMPLQYENVYGYDLLAATQAEDNDKLISYMENHTEVTEYLNIQVESVKLKNEKKESEKVQLMILPHGADISAYVNLTNENLEPISIGEEGIYLTENASRILDLAVGDKAYIQKLDLTQKEVQVTSLVKNYLGNSIYMSQSAYEEIFGAYDPNGVLTNLSDSCSDQIAFAEKLAEEDWILSSVSTEELKATFSQAFTLINLVVYVVLVLAACLAFVVLFTLASINISERERELATIKVLGFFDKEVHSYVNKETLILTIIGILIGLPAGAFLSSLLTDLLNMPSIYFAITIYNRSYWIAAGIALGFAFIVQFMTDRSLDIIDPVEALKSVE